MKNYNLIEELNAIKNGTSIDEIVSNLDNQEQEYLHKIKIIKEKEYILSILSLNGKINNIVENNLNDTKDVNLSIYIGKDIKRNHAYEYMKLTTALSIGFIDSTKKSVKAYEKPYLLNILKVLDDAKFCYDLSGLNEIYGLNSTKQQFVFPLSDTKNQLLKHLLSSEVRKRLEMDMLETNLPINNNQTAKKIKI